ARLRCAGAPHCAVRHQRVARDEEAAGACPSRLLMPGSLPLTAARFRDSSLYSLYRRRRAASSPTRCASQCRRQGDRSMILVTGADGFVGRHLIARLAREGERPLAMVRNVPRARKVLPERGVMILEADTTRYVTLASVLEDVGVDTIVHCAFITANRKQKTGVNYYQTNVLGTRNLVAASKEAGVKRIVVVGGLGTKPDRPRSYMQGRYEADQAVTNSGLAYSILGPSVQFGGGLAFFTGLADLIRSPLPFVPMIGRGRLKFQPIWVEDVVTCLLKMVHEPGRYDGRYLQVGGPEAYTYAEILDLLMQQ